MRLDARPYAAEGGDTQQPVLGGTLESNELYQRVSSTDRTYRMPKNADPLTPDEVDRLRRWVEQGTPWPDAYDADRATGRRSWHERAFEWTADLTYHYEFEFQYAQPFIFAFIVGQLAILAVIRAKSAFQSGRPWTTGRWRRWASAASRVTTGELLLACLLLTAGLTITLMRGHQLKLDQELARLTVVRDELKSGWSQTVYGFPPMPIRPDHPAQVAGTYYRGNCERNPSLFNGGNYLTATFRIHLCDAEGKVVGVGDSVPPEGLYIRLEIERGPGTTDQLFSKELMASVFLSQEFYLNTMNELRDEPSRLETLEVDKRWAAQVSIGKPNEQGMLSGLIYVYTGRIENDTARGDAQYGIKYDLRVVDGKLSAESDLWMSSLTVGNNIAPPHSPTVIPFEEWFDYRPIPAITGENSQDPKLLGVEEYIKKGLIEPAPDAQPEK